MCWAVELCMFENRVSFLSIYQCSTYAVWCDDIKNKVFTAHKKCACDTKVCYFGVIGHTLFCMLAASTTHYLVS